HSDGGESTNVDLSGHSRSIETPSNQGTLDGKVTATQFRNTEHNEKRPLAYVSLDSSHKVQGDILTTRKWAALAEIDMNSVVESARTAEYTRRARRKRIANLFISRNQSMPETLCQMDENQQSFIVKGLLSGDFRHHKNASTISGGSGGKWYIFRINDRTARRERMSKLFNSRNQSIPSIVLDKTVACSISAPALKDHSDNGLLRINEKPKPITSDGSLGISDVTLAELKSRTKGPYYVCN
ncbi:hypothetical protein PIB30_046704, partial [Stylosanthes scabra]|nr:hypothetical protein [Stylosanthes scabra]